MKNFYSKIIILVIILLGCVSLQAQSLMTRKGQYLYAGIENRIELFPVQSMEQYNVSFPGCKVEAKDDCYYVTPSESLMDKGVIATIKTKGNAKQESIQQRFFVKKVPNPHAIWGAGLSSSMTKEEFLENPFLRAAMDEDFPYDIVWEIITYKIVLFTDEGMQPAFICEGGQRLSESTAAYIKNKKDIKLIIITDIKARSEVGERYLKDIVYMIK